MINPFLHASIFIAAIVMLLIAAAFKSDSEDKDMKVVIVCGLASAWLFIIFFNLLLD